MPNPDVVSVRVAGADDVPLMELSRRLDQAGHADDRMTAYFQGRHHPQQALSSRVGYLALFGDRPVGYAAGHLTSRFGYSGELQYLFVASSYRRRGIGRQLVEELSRWLAAQGAFRVCVCVDPDSPAAAPFYASLGARPFKPHWYAWENIAVLVS